MFLSLPFPSYASPVRVLRLTFLAGFVVFLILLLFKPFNIGKQGNHFSIWHAAVYGLATFITSSLNAVLMPRLFPEFSKEEKWTVGKEMLVMLWQIVSISFVNVVVTHFLYGEGMGLYNVVNFLGITAAVGIFPVTLVILLKQQLLFRKYTAGAALLEKQLQEEPVASAPDPAADPLPEMASLTGDNLNEQAILTVESIRYIVAADNYIKIHYDDHGVPAHKVLRSTLKKAQAALENHPQIFRCHRAYLVNLAAVYHVSGNAQGFKLHLRGTNEQIPVSRSLNNDLSEHLNKHSQVSR